MHEWCLEHPWMTFILLLVLFGSIKINYSSKSFGRELKQEARIHELEEIICPCEQHDWLLVGSFQAKKKGELKKIKRFVCKRCRKTKEEKEE